MEDGRAVEMLVGDQIDVLIDLSMHSAGNRLGVFARRAAPVQMTYLGYCGSTGLSTMDYRLSDPYLDDAQTEKDYVEKTLYLPQTYWCYSPGGEVPEVSEPPMKRKGYITFGCLNNFAKMSVWVQELWSRILREVKGSHLLLHSQPGSHVDELKSRFESWGISSDRLEIVAKQRWEQYMNSYSQIDICLDPSPYGGGITTCDALMMGVGVVTVVGRLPVSRAGKSILSNVGLKELIAKDAEEYVKIATELALDETRLTELRRTLRDRLKASPLMDAPRFTRALESLIKQAWNVWIESEARS
jgi:predicted O-linked N-acetylglucosamine transferase (SPINDLY family)